MCHQKNVNKCSKPLILETSSGSPSERCVHVPTSMDLKSGFSRTDVYNGSVGFKGPINGHRGRDDTSITFCHSFRDFRLDPGEPFRRHLWRCNYSRESGDTDKEIPDSSRTTKMKERVKLQTRSVKDIGHSGGSVSKRSQIGFDLHTRVSSALRWRTGLSSVGVRVQPSVLHSPLNLNKRTRSVVSQRKDVQSQVDRPWPEDKPYLEKRNKDSQDQRRQSESKGDRNRTILHSPTPTTTKRGVGIYRTSSIPTST